MRSAVGMGLATLCTGAPGPGRLSLPLKPRQAPRDAPHFQPREDPYSPWASGADGVPAAGLAAAGEGACGSEGLQLTTLWGRHQ